MNTTIESTVTAAELRALLGARAQPVINACNGVQAQQPVDAQTEKALRLLAEAQARAKRMRSARTAWLEAHIEDVIRTKRPALELKARCYWTSIILSYYERHGLDAPSEKVVRRVVREFKGGF